MHNRLEIFASQYKRNQASLGVISLGRLYWTNVFFHSIFFGKEFIFSSIFNENWNIELITLLENIRININKVVKNGHIFQVSLQTHVLMNIFL